MPEILSQGQIDELLSNFGKGNTTLPQMTGGDGRPVRDYDFKAPRKFTKERLRTVESLHENFARSVTSFLTSILRVYCEVNVLQIEEQRYYEYSNALPDVALISTIDLNPVDENISETRVAMDLSTTIGFFMIDRLLGGTGDGYNLSREFTKTEKAILRFIFDKFARFMEEAWCTYIEVTAHLSELETNSRLFQINAQEDVVVIVVLDVKVKSLSGKLNICIPATNLEEMLGNFSSRYTHSTRKLDVDREKEKRQNIMNAILLTDLELKAQLDEFELDLQDVLQLQVGDVIPLNKSVDSDICVLVEDTPWFTAKLGQTKLKKAVRANKFM